MIKKVICAVALSFFATFASAGPLAYLNNESGGQIIITDDKCPDGKGLRALATSPKGDFIEGCWGFLDGKVVVIYSDNDIKIYSDSKWTLTKYGETVLGKKPESKPEKNKYSL